MRRSLRTRSLAGAAAVLGLAAIATLVSSAGAPAATGRAGAVSAAHKCLVMTGSGDPAFTKNFNPYAGGGLPSNAIAQGAFYEPLIVTPAGGGRTLPWLARTWKWTNGNKTLTMNLARNAKWSDGKRLTSTDVVYSMTAGRQDKAMDRLGLIGADNNIASIRAKGTFAVVIKLKTADSQFIPAILNRQFVVPKHVWSKVKDAATFANPNPVGSGPFNRIGRFTGQDYVLNKNPHYWQAGLPKVACLEYVQASSNDAALALIQSGQVDWTHNFVPNAEQAYEAKDKQHYHAFYSNRDYPISLVFDDTQYPYSIVAFRKALSLAIDRNSVWKLGEYGYEPPADAIGLSGLFPQWVTDKSVKAQAKAMPLQPDRSQKMLTDSGSPTKAATCTTRRATGSARHHVIGAGRTGSPRTRSSRRTSATSGSTRRCGSSRPGATGSRTHSRPRIRRCSGRSPRADPPTASSTRTCPRTRSSRRAQTRARPGTGSTTRMPRQRRFSTNGRSRSARRNSTRSPRSWRRSGSRTCRSSRW